VARTTAHAIRIWDTLLTHAFLLLVALAIGIGVPVATFRDRDATRLLNLAFLPWIAFMAWTARATPYTYLLTDELVIFRTPTGSIEVALADVEAMELPWYSSWGNLRYPSGSVSLPAGISRRVYSPLIRAARAANPSVQVRGRWRRAT
jgi:hypothetical protein